MSDNLIPYITRESRIVYQNPWITVTEDEVLRPNQEVGIFGVVQMSAGSTVIPLTDDGYVYLVNEYKYGIRGVSLEAISGALESGESALVAAQRELQEEVGLVAENWTDLGLVNPFTTVINSPNYMFLAEGLHEVPSSPDGGEVLITEKVALETALEWVDQSVITHGATCVALLKAARILGTRSM